jgi:hypothetical protein
VQGGGGENCVGTRTSYVGTVCPLLAVGVGRAADMSLVGFHMLWDKILLQNLQAVADQGCHLEGSSPDKETAYRGVYCRSIAIDTFMCELGERGFSPSHCRILKGIL